MWLRFGIWGFIAYVTFINLPGLLKTQHFLWKDNMLFLFAKCWGSDLTNNLFQGSSWPLEKPRFFSVTAHYLEKDQYKSICRLCSNFGPCWPLDLLTQPPTYWKWHLIILQIFDFLVVYLDFFFCVRCALESNQETQGKNTTQEIKMFLLLDQLYFVLAWAQMCCSSAVLFMEKQIPAC